MSNERYSRQILFREIGASGQKLLADARVLVLGCGALGAAHAEGLARAGVGFLKLIDRDFVEFSNLQRQTLYSEDDARNRMPKAVAARKRLETINSEIEYEDIVTDIDHTNIEELISDVDLIIDGTDNFQIRYIANDAAVKHNKPWIYGAAVSSYGSTMTIIPGETACLRCVFEEIPAPGSSPTCDTAGVIQPIISIISALQVTEALKLLCGQRDALHGSLIQFDAWSADFRKIKGIKQREDCETCIDNNFEFLQPRGDEFLTTLCGRDAVQIKPRFSKGFDLGKLADNLVSHGTVISNEYLLRLNADGYEISVFKDGRAIIKGLDDVEEANSIYARYVGN